VGGKVLCPFAQLGHRNVFNTVSDENFFGLLAVFSLNASLLPDDADFLPGVVILHFLH